MYSMFYFIWHYLYWLNVTHGHYTVIKVIIIQLHYIKEMNLLFLFYFVFYWHRQSISGWSTCSSWSRSSPRRAAVPASATDYLVSRVEAERTCASSTPLQWTARRSSRILSPFARTPRRAAATRALRANLVAVVSSRSCSPPQPILRTVPPPAPNQHPHTRTAHLLVLAQAERRATAARPAWPRSRRASGGTTVLLLRTTIVKCLRSFPSTLHISDGQILQNFIIDLQVWVIDIMLSEQYTSHISEP